jgi:TonB family protein
MVRARQSRDRLVAAGGREAHPARAAEGDNIRPMYRYAAATLALILLSPAANIRAQDAPKPAAVLQRPADAAYPSGRLVVEYSLEQPADSVEIDIFDARDAVVAAWSSGPTVQRVAAPADRFVLPEALTRPGSHTVIWDLHAGGYFSAGAPGGPGRYVPGPLVPPGLFVVQRTAHGLSLRQAFKVAADPPPTAERQAALDARFAFAMQVRGRASAASAAIKRARVLRARVQARLKTTTDTPLADSGEALLNQLARIEGAPGDVVSSSAGLVPLCDALAALLGEIERGRQPTDAQKARYQELIAGVQTHVVVLNALTAGSLARFERGEAPPSRLSGSEFGAATIQLDSKGVDLRAWLGGYIAGLKKNWFIPQSAMASKGRVVVSLGVRKSGVVTGIDVVGPSDVAAFNDSAREAVFAARPALPLPDAYPADVLALTITFYFNEQPRAKR